MTLDYNECNQTFVETILDYNECNKHLWERPSITTNVINICGNAPRLAANVAHCYPMTACVSETLLRTMWRHRWGYWPCC